VKISILLILSKYYLFNTYFFAILGGSLKNTDANSTIKVPISRKVYTSVSMLCKIYIVILLM